MQHATRHVQLTCLGLEIFCIGSSAISFHCATHPTVLATANKTVYLHKTTHLHASHQMLAWNKGCLEWGVSQNILIDWNATVHFQQSISSLSDYLLPQADENNLQHSIYSCKEAESQLWHMKFLRLALTSVQHIQKSRGSHGDGNAHSSKHNA